MSTGQTQEATAQPGKKRTEPARVHSLRRAGRRNADAALAGFVPTPAVAHRLASTRRVEGCTRSERDFRRRASNAASACRSCPVEAIHLADLADGYGVGVPYIEGQGAGP